MSGVYSTSGLYIPTEWLVWLATSWLRRVCWDLQGGFQFIRAAHVLAMALFFGTIATLDFRLIRGRGTVAAAALAQHVLPWTIGSLAIALVTGVLLFMFDPIRVGSHTWFLPKLILVALGVVNALWLHRRGFRTEVALVTVTPRLRRAAWVSLVLWTGAIACASLNTGERPLSQSPDATGIAFRAPS